MMNQNDATSSFLTQLEVTEIDNVIKRAPDRDLTFADVFAIKQLANPNAETGWYYVADSDEGSVHLLRSLAECEKIFVSAQKVTYPVYLMGIGYNLKVSDIEASRAWNQPLDTQEVSRATRAVQEKLNKLAYVGDSEFGVPGILSEAGITAITGTTLSSSTTKCNDFIGYFNSLPVIYRNRFQYTLVVADREYKELVKIGNTYNDKSVADQLKAAIPNLTIAMPEVNLDAGTALYDGSTVAAGTALLIPKAVEACNMPLAKAPNTTMKMYEDIQEIKGTVNARAGPVEVIFPTSIGKITGL